MSKPIPTCPRPTSTPPPPPQGSLPHGNIWVPRPRYLYHQSTQFRWSASELLLFVSVVLVLINALYGILNCDELVSQQLIYYDKKGHFHILFYCLNSLICCRFLFLFVLNVPLLLGTADAEILRSPLLKTRSWRMFSLKGTEQVRIQSSMLIHCQNFFLVLTTFTFIFFQILSMLFNCVSLG